MMNLNFKMYIIIFFLFLSMNLFIMNFKNILINLMMLEMFILNVFMFMYNLMNFFKMNIYFIFLFLTISICESILGLSLMIFLIRFKGNDYVNLMNLIKW